MIFLDTKVISETLRKTPNPAVIAWLLRNDAELALPTVTIAEIAFGIGKIHPDQRAARLEQGLASWRHRFADRIFPFTEAVALAYGDIMSATLRQGRPMTAPDGMIAAIAHLNGGRLNASVLPHPHKRLAASLETRQGFVPVSSLRECAMKAVVCEAFGGPEVLALREVPDPPPPGPGELQVRIEARGVQYVDVLMLAGKYQFRPEPPFIPGGEGAGEVVAVGSGVTGFKPGDRVMSRHRLGAFAELGNSKAEDCDLVPGAMSLDEAAVFRGAYHTAYHALLQRGRLSAGNWVMIHGAAGGIGLPAIQIAKLRGAHVIATASTEVKRSVCLEEGADHAIDYQGGFRDKVVELTGGRGVDIIYDPVNGPTFEESLRCLAWSGRILILGFLGGAPALARTNYLLIKGIEAIGVRIGGLNETHPDIAAANVKTLVELAGQGKLKPRIWRRFPLAAAADAIQALIDRKVIGKAVLTG